MDVNDPIELDEAAIFHAIEQEDASASAKEEAAQLVDCWTQETLAEDLKYPVLAVEAGFYIQLPNKVFVIGVLDKIAQDDEGVFGCEWKTVAAESRFWNEDKWFEEISRGHQLSTYAAALQYGTFVGNIPPLHKNAFQQMSSPRILVRAISKSSPPVIWPGPAGALVTVDDKRIDATFAAYQNAAEAIRAMKGTGQVPWQLPGYICTKYLKYPCPHYDVCHEYRQPQGQVSAASRLSPGSQKVLDYLIGQGMIDDDTIVLSTSTLADWMDCPEKWRQNALPGAEDDRSNATDIGGVFHAAIAEVGRQLMRRRK